MTGDLSVDGPYSPVSLKKYLTQDAPKEKKKSTNDPVPALRVLIDGTGLGIALDDPETIYITSEDRIEQARYYREQVFDGKSIPAYLFRYLHYMFIAADDKVYPTDESVIQAYRSGQLTVESGDYKGVVNLVKYSNHNVEAAQIIGFIQLMAGALNISKKQQRPVQLFIQHPETGLHPKRAARWMSMFYKLQAEYGIKKEANDQPRT